MTNNDSTKSRNENRFTFEDEELSFGIKDNGKLISVKDLLKIANHLNNENHELKLLRKAEFDELAIAEICKQISKENTHIKHTIQVAYETERTHIGRNVLKQLMEAIQ